MTPTRYFICRIVQTFGLRRKVLRMGDAAGETHLLKEAEAHLGQAVWKNVEHIESLSMEYWNLRKLSKERDQMAEELAKRDKLLAQAHEERANLLSTSNEPFQDLIGERQRVLNELEEFARQRDMVVARARDIRRNYDGLKMKQEVLTKEGGHTPEEVEKINKRLGGLKQDFIALKNERHAIAAKINQGDLRIDAIDVQIQERKKERRDKASEAFQHIGDANHGMSTFRAELGILDTRMRQLFSEIGRYVSRNAAHDPECAKACKEHRALVEVMGALRKSIQLNHKLAELA